MFQTVQRPPRPCRCSRPASASCYGGSTPWWRRNTRRCGTPPWPTRCWPGEEPRTADPCNGARDGRAKYDAMQREVSLFYCTLISLCVGLKRSPWSYLSLMWKENTNEFWIGSSKKLKKWRSSTPSIPTTHPTFEGFHQSPVSNQDKRNWVKQYSHFN